MADNKIIGLCLSAVIIVSFLLFPLYIYAKDLPIPELKVGPAKLKPSLSTQTEYHSNINLTNNDQESSLIYRITPGLSLRAPLAFNSERAFFGIEADTAYVSAEDRLGDTTWTGHARGLFRYNFSNLTSLGLSHDYSTGDLYGTVSGDDFELQQSQAILKHEFTPRLSLSLGGDREKYDTHLQTTEFFTDYTQNDGKAALDYQLSRLTTLTLSGMYGERDYNERSEKDYQFATGDLGISQKLTSRITLGLNGGYTTRNYDSDEDLKEITYGGGLSMVLSPFSTLNLNAQHGIQDTFAAKDTTVLKNPFATDETLMNILDENYRYIETDQVNANLTYRLTSKDTIDMGGGFIRSRSGQDMASLVPSMYSSQLIGVKLREKNYYGGLGYSHKFTSWMSFDLKGTYGVRTSNTREKYDYYTATGGLSLSY